MYSKFKLVRILQNLFFVFKTRRFSSKMSVLSRGHVWRRMIRKNVDFLSSRNTRVSAKPLFMTRGLFSREWKIISDHWLRTKASLWNRGSGQLGNGLLTIWRQISCRQLPNHLQNLHLLRHTFFAVKHHLMQKTQSKSLGHFSRGKEIFGRPKFKKLKFRIVY